MSCSTLHDLRQFSGCGVGVRVGYQTQRSSCGQVIDNSALATIAPLSLEPVDHQRPIESARALPRIPATSEGNGEIGLTRPASQHNIALLGMKPPVAIARQRVVYRRALELEVGEAFGERQLGDGELVFDRARFFSSTSAVSGSPVSAAIRAGV
jgi:hypothetical protein